MTNLNGHDTRNKHRLQAATLERRLLELDVDLGDPALQEQLQDAEERAADLIQRESDDPDFEKKSRAIQDKGALAVMLQIVVIHSGLGPLLNVLIILFDWWRVSAVIDTILPSIWAYTFGMVIILMFTYLALDHAEWLYETRDRRRRFTLRVWWERLRYFWNGENEAVGRIDLAEHKAREMGRFMRFFKLTLLTSFMIGVLNAPPGHMPQAFVMALFSLIAIIGLEKQLERQYFLWRSRFGGQIKSESFFIEREQSFLERRRQARTDARYMMLYRIYKQRQSELNDS